MTELIGWIGGILFAVCGLPQAIQSFKQGHSLGLSSLFLAMWTSGEVLTLVYVLLKHGLDWPLVFNYGMNLLFLTVIIYFKIKPRSLDV